MDLKEIKRLIEIVEEAAVSHVSIETEGIKVEIKKELAGAPVAIAHTIAAPVAAAPAPIAAPAAQAVEAPKAPAADANLVPVKSQMVGTFYLTASPEAPAYVKVGDAITKGQVVCIIEAMKLFNEIETEIAGTVEKICVANGSPVQYGQELFLIRVG
ncbi:MAG: acetyl-CoA carboxylase biotin carboxyl carrier protein [Candidatus Margulisiibacteriota bacterium]